MSRPLIIWVARRDDVGDRAVGMTAEIDAFDAQEIVAAAPPARNAGIMVEQIEQPFVVEGCARHADRGMHAQGQGAALGILTIGTYDRWREPVTFIERGRSGRDIGAGAEANALDPIGVLEARQVAQQRVLQDRNEIFFQEHAGRLTACILHDLDIMWRERVASPLRARAQASSQPTEMDGGSTSPTRRECRRRGPERPHRGHAELESGPRPIARDG